MKLRRQIRGLLGNVVFRYTSRYSDYDGYWLFGQLIQVGDGFTFDLLNVSEPHSGWSIASAAHFLAGSTFRMQLEKSCIPQSCIRSASMFVVNTRRMLVGPVNHRPTNGYIVEVSALAVSDLGKQYSMRHEIFVAPHDPVIETRSIRRELFNSAH